MTKSIELTERAHVAAAGRGGEYMYFLMPKLARSILQQQGGRFLDVGCGRGFILEAVADLIAEGVGVDIDARMLAEASLRLADLSHVSLKSGDACAIPFGDSVFDAATMFSTLVVLPDAAKALSEMRRVLKPGALSVVHFTGALNANSRYWDRWYRTNKGIATNIYTLKGAHSLLLSQGFTPVSWCSSGITDARRHLRLTKEMQGLDPFFHGSDGKPDLDFKISNLPVISGLSSHFYFVARAT